MTAVATRNDTARDTFRQGRHVRRAPIVPHQTDGFDQAIPVTLHYRTENGPCAEPLLILKSSWWRANMKNKQKRVYGSVADRLVDILAQWGLLPQPMLRPIPVRVKSRYRRPYPRRDADYRGFDD